MNKVKSAAVILVGLLCATTTITNLVLLSRPTENCSTNDVQPYSCSEYMEIQPVSAQTISTKNKAYFELSSYERSVVEKIVSGEARGESLKGQMLVAQCILDACIIDGIQPSQVRINYGYSGWNESVSDTTKEAVSKVFDDGELPVNAPILYFYNPKWGRSSFHESQRFVIQEGNHKFFAEW